MTTILVSVLLRRNLEWISILRLMLQTPITDHHRSRDKALDREDGSQLLALRIRSLPLLQESVASVLPMTMILVSVLLRRNLEWMSILRLMLQTPIADHQRSRDKALDRENGSQHLAVRYLRIRSLPLLQEFATSILPMTTILVSVLLRRNLEWMSILRLMFQTPIADHHRSKDNALDREDGSQLRAKLEGNLDALVNLVTQLATNQKPASIARVCGIRSSNDHHTSVCPSSQQSGFSARNDAIVIRGFHDVATDTSPETRKLEGKLDVLVNLVTQLAANQKPASVATVCGVRSYNDHHTSAVHLRSNLELMSILRLMLQTPIADHHSSRDKALDREDVSQLLADTFAEIRKLEGKLDALVNLVTQLATNQKPASVARVCGICSSIDHHTSVYPSSQQSGVDEHAEGYAANTNNTFAETRKLEGKLDALVNLVTQLAENKKPACVARVCGICFSKDHHTSVYPSSQQSGVDEHVEGYAANTNNTSAETRKLEGKLDALVNLVTQLAANQKSASVPRVYGIRSSNKQHTSLEGKLDSLVNLVTPLAVNQKPASAARVYGMRSSNDHHTSQTTTATETRDLIDKMAPNSSQFSARNYAIVIRGVHDVTTDTSVETRKLEGMLDTLVNLVTQLAVNQKPASVARVCGIRSSNDHHSSITTAADTRHLMEKKAPNS
ncbi:hypothetical protein Fmac_028509 [Flemingia macrophylla]|uniref:Uncharacterized protein n=1 Tax=Flemingia macrophylla TaxID=520843 RepID=A0ABD1L7P4_9FABA